MECVVLIFFTSLEKYSDFFPQNDLSLCGDRFCLLIWTLLHMRLTSHVRRIWRRRICDLIMQRAILLSVVLIYLYYTSRPNCRNEVSLSSRIADNAAQRFAAYHCCFNYKRIKNVDQWCVTRVKAKKKERAETTFLPEPVTRKRCLAEQPVAWCYVYCDRF